MIGYTMRVGSLLLRHAAFGDRAEPNQPFSVSMRAWPWLCDAYRHLNNSAYLRLAEDARWAWTARTPLLGRSLKERWFFLVAGADILYRRPIPLLSPFQITCRVEGADDRFLYLSQEFTLPSGKSACRILLRATIRGREGAVPPREVFAVAGYEIPDASAELRQMQALVESQLAAMRKQGESRAVSDV